MGEQVDLTSWKESSTLEREPTVKNKVYSTSPSESNPYVIKGDDLPDCVSLNDKAKDKVTKEADATGQWLVDIDKIIDHNSHDIGNDLDLNCKADNSSEQYKKVVGANANHLQPVCSDSTSYHTVDPMVRIKMLARVSLSDAHFRHQQRGEPDLTEDEKTEIAQTVLDEGKAKFLSRFGNYLELEDLEFFQESLNDYEVNFYVNQIRKSKASKYQRNRVKNRRFEAMKSLMDKGEYFSEDEMKFREPYLYEQMIGKYLTDDELYAKVDKSDLRFSTILLKHIDQLDENARFSRSKDKEEGQEEEEESSEDSEDEEEMETEGGKDQVEEKKEKISANEKQELRDEFLSIMQQKFLEGQDKTFDYSSVDNNEAYDDLTVLNQEAEEKYFDED